MSQQLVPTNGGVQEVQTTVLQSGLDALSKQYVKANRLESRPTEWVPGGRPIYRRLPAVSETYQVDFFNLVPPANTAARFDGIQDIGYVYVPWGEGINGSLSTEVVASDSFQDILIKAGTIIWKYGPCPVLPTIVNLRNLDLGSGRYLVAYQLVYDDAPVNHLYRVEDFALTGQPLNITSSTDSIIGWRRPAVNAFLNTASTFWTNKDTYFPLSIQPATAYLQWTSNLSAAYSKIVLRCPPKTAYTGTATLFYVDGAIDTPVMQVPISVDQTSQYFEFNVEEPPLQKGWKVEWSSNDMSIQSIVVDGTITQSTSPAGKTPQSSLVIYPANSVPDTVVNSNGQEIPATYCQLAYIDVNSAYKLTDIVDLRYIIHRDFQPVADWLTDSFDANLINLFEQVSSYVPLWMAPPSAMKQEYAALEKDQVEVQ